MSPPSFPPAVPCHGIPFPPRGPLDRFPRFVGTTGMLGRPAIPRASLRFLRSALPPCARFFLLSRRRGAPRCRAGVCHGVPLPVRRWKRLGLPGSWGTFAHMPCSPTPTGPARQAITACRCCLPQFWNTSAPATLYFGAQSHGLRSRCLRFAARVSPGPRKTRFRLGAGLGRAGLATRKVPGEVSALLHGFLLTQASPGAPKTRSWHWTSGWHRATLERNVPRTRSLALLGAGRAALRTHTDLALENLALRQQLALLRHRSKRPRFGRLDRAFWVWLSRRWAGWRKALYVVRPETVIRWHPQGFRAFWTWKSRRGRTGRPPVGSELAELVRTMALANPLWGAPGIHGELLKLGFGFHSGPLRVSCRAAGSHPRRLGERSSRTTSPTLPPLTSSSCRRRPSVCSTCSWSFCNIAVRSCTSTSPISRRPHGLRSRSSRRSPMTRRRAT